MYICIPLRPSADERWPARHSARPPNTSPSAPTRQPPGIRWACRRSTSLFERSIQTRERRGGGGGERASSRMRRRLGTSANLAQDAHDILDISYFDIRIMNMRYNKLRLRIFCRLYKTNTNRFVCIQSIIDPNIKASGAVCTNAQRPPRISVV